MNASIPKIGTRWQHKNSKAIYEVYDITNEESTKPDEYPIMISYRRLTDGSKWSRPLARWYKSYLLVGGLE